MGIGRVAPTAGDHDGVERLACMDAPADADWRSLWLIEGRRNGSCDKIMTEGRGPPLIHAEFSLVTRTCFCTFTD
jgi:hypothetical protein